MTSQQPTPATPTPPATERGRWPLVVPFLVALLAVALAVGLLVSPVSLADLLARTIRWLESAGPIAPFLFVLVHAAAVVLLVPGAVFPVAAGLLFGTATGTVCSVLGKTLGACLAFLIGRHLLRGRAASYIAEHPKLSRLDRRLAREGWKTVALLRLVPIVPFKLSNYVFGMARFRLRDVLLGTLVGTVPFSWINARVGSLAASLGELTERPAPSTPSEWGLTLAGLAIALVAALLLTRLAHRALTAPPRQTTPPGGEAFDAPPP